MVAAVIENGATDSPVEVVGRELVGARGRSEAAAAAARLRGGYFAWVGLVARSSVAAGAAGRAATVVAATRTTAAGEGTMVATAGHADAAESDDVALAAAMLAIHVAAASLHDASAEGSARVAVLVAALAAARDDAVCADAGERRPGGGERQPA